MAKNDGPILEVLATHSKVLAKHSEVLADHGAMLREIRNRLRDTERFRRSSGEVSQDLDRLWTRCDDLAEEENKELTAVKLMQKTYRDPNVPLPMRLRAAEGAAPYESSKQPTRLSITDLAAQLEQHERMQRAIARSNSVRLIELKPNEGEGSDAGD
jgi:hypothetical protein